ncbi:MAG: ROK family protein [Candidatus Cyclobacteriaceae bacterium M2_1C_046]
MDQVIVGIDIGGTSTKYGLVTKDGEVIFQGKLPTQKYPDFDEYLDTLHKALQNAIGSTNKDLKIIGVGVGAPNANSNKGTIEKPPNLPWKGIIPFTEKLKEKVNVPVVITNDANAAAVGEMTFGKAKGMKDFLVITLGTGLGSGIVSNGKVINGHYGLAGELGHVLVNPDGRQCSCGKKGCLETYVSATGIKRTVYKLLADRLEDSKLRGVSFNELSPKMITEAALNNDPIALAAFEYTGKILGTKLSDTVVHTDPEAIFMFGGLSLAGDLIFNPTKKYMEEYLMPVFRNKVKILPSGLQNQSAPILGASSLVRDKIKD